MARGRHARPSWWRALSWRDVHAVSLLRLSDDLVALQAEVVGLRTTTERTTERSTAADVVAELRAARLEDELAAARAEVAALRRDLDALREDVVWAYAERRLPVSAPQRGAARRSG